MKIVFLNIYQGINQRGAERSTRELCRRFSVRHQVTLFHSGKSMDNEKFKTVSLPVLLPNLPDSSSDFLRKFYLDDWSLQILFFTLMALPKLLTIDFDILSPVNGGWQTLIAKVVCMVRRRRLVIIGRAGIGRDDAVNLIFWPDLFISLTGRGAAWAQKRNPRVKVISIPNGVDTNKFRPGLPAAGIKLDPPVIISAGALTANKRMDHVLEAVARMRNKASLLIIGSGPLWKKLELSGNSLLGRRRFKIVSSDFDNIPALYNAGKIFTLASVEGEAFGNVYLEAMACNLPVVAPSGYREQIAGKGGLYFAAGDISDFAGKLDLALTRKWDRLPKRQAAKYDWNGIFPLYEKAFKRLAGGK